MTAPSQNAQHDAECAVDADGRTYKRYEPAVMMGSALGWSARCGCEWGTGIRPTMDEAVDAYTAHVDATHDASEVS